jgi:hypothetical protein
MPILSTEDADPALQTPARISSRMVVPELNSQPPGSAPDIAPWGRGDGLRACSPGEILSAYAQLLCVAQQLGECKFWVRIAIAQTDVRYRQVIVIYLEFLLRRFGMELE